MATWELNCHSIPSSTGDKELAPYLARQKAMREFFERALFVTKDQDNNGLYFLGATMGSGKNYTAEQVTADLIAGGWDESGCFNKCPGRRILVFVVPGKDNRDNYVASARQLLVGQGMDCDDAARMVFDLPRAGENIKNWIDATFDKGSVRPRDIPCPFGAKDEAVTDAGAVCDASAAAVTRLRGIDLAEAIANGNADDADEALNAKIAAAHDAIERAAAAKIELDAAVAATDAVAPAYLEALANYTAAKAELDQAIAELNAEIARQEAAERGNGE